MNKSPSSLIRSLWQNGTVCVVLLAFLYALQAMFAVGYFHPTSGVGMENALADVVMKEWLWIVKPEDEKVAYRIFVFCALIFTALGCVWLKRSEPSKDVLKDLKFRLTLESLLTFFLISALFKIVVYHQRAELATIVFQLLLLLAVFLKVFYKTIREFIFQIRNLLFDDTYDGIFSRLGFWLSLGLIVLIIHIPKPQVALAKAYFGDHLMHFNSFIAAPAWVHYSGNLLNVDQGSQYGFGLPVMVAEMTKWLGGYSYLNVYKVIVGCTLVYFLTWFMLMKFWFRNVTAALAAILVCIRTQMFHTGVSPLIFTLPSATAIRFLIDMFIVAGILLHARSDKFRYLIFSSVFCGVAIYYLFSTGVFITAGFFAYLVMLGFIPHLRQKYIQTKQDWGKYGALFVIPFVLMIVFVYMTIGSYALSGETWGNIARFTKYFAGGPGNVPIYKTLLEGHYFANAMGYVLPLTFVFSMITSGTLVFLGRLKQEHLLVVVLSVYGLGLYHYYVLFSMITSYYTGGAMFGVICGWWLNQWLKGLDPIQRKKVGLTAVALAVWALATNHNFLCYPNKLNVSRNPITDNLVNPRLDDGRYYFHHLYVQENPAVILEEGVTDQPKPAVLNESFFFADDQVAHQFQQEFDYTDDVKLIHKYYKEDEKVPLVANYEVQTLIQANRRPFWYSFPITVSRVKYSRTWMSSNLWTSDHYDMVIKQLDEEKPEYVFMEKIFMVKELPNAFRYRFPTLLKLVQHIRENYQPLESSENLTVLKRR